MHVPVKFLVYHLDCGYHMLFPQPELISQVSCACEVLGLSPVSSHEIVVITCCVQALWLNKNLSL